MSYYPKKMVNNNLYANRGEFSIADTGQDYEGYYHETYNGLTFSGKTPLDPNKQQLIKSTTLQRENTINQLPSLQEGLTYNGLGSTESEIYRFGDDPESFIPRPTGADYKRGYITRYFATRRNQSPPRIVEIPQQVYEDISKRKGIYNYTLWRVISLFWRISGPLRDTRDRNGIITKGIVNTNERIREEANQQMKGIKSYLPNLIQFAVKEDLTLISNQYTGGNEYTVKLDNSNYVGYYHVMADGTIMDGATHTQSQGKTLLPANVVVQGQINTLIKEELRKIGVV
jgi:hypothetical protein